jgi:hypothetical protein
VSEIAELGIHVPEIPNQRPHADEGFPMKPTVNPMLPNCNIVIQHRPHRVEKHNFNAPERPRNAPFTPITPEAARLIPI